MLVLTRKINEDIIIDAGGKSITIRVVDVKGHGPSARVRVGIEAPLEFQITRKELTADSQKAHRP